jgi:putative OmpL-like beta-barrel porin-2
MERRPIASIASSRFGWTFFDIKPYKRVGGEIIALNSFYLEHPGDIQTMKKILTLTLLILFIVIHSSSASAKDSENNWVRGDFQMTGFLTVGTGWQRFSNDPVTASYGGGGGYPGVLGDVLPNIFTNTPPAPGSEHFQLFAERFQLNCVKDLGKRLSMQAEIYFGRAGSGSSANGITLEHAAIRVLLSKKYNVYFDIGRIGLVTGIESYEYYYNDTISLSILSRAPLYPGPLTGAMFSSRINDNIKVSLGASNTMTGDTSIGQRYLPGAIAILEVDWGPEEKQSYMALTQYVGPEPGGNKQLTFGVNLDLEWWFTEKWQLALEALYKGFKGGGNPTTNYAAGILRIHRDIGDDWFTYVKYSFGRQFEVGNVNTNLTGTKQNIHESSIGFGHFIMDGVKISMEGRFDIIDPANSRTQYVPGVAMSMNYAF